MNNRRIGKLIITGIVAALSAISGFVAVEMAKTAKGIEMQVMGSDPTDYCRVKEVKTNAVKVN